MSTDYRPPLDDIAFTLATTCRLDDLSALDGFTHADRATVAALVAEAGRFFAETFAPLNTVGDRTGSVRNDDGTVTTPPGFAEAYAAYVAAGWGSVPFDPAYGGGGFPWTVGIALQEMLTSANMGFSLLPLLTQGAIDAISHHGDAGQQAAYLPKMITGEWSGTMNLTEPDAGSDVGAVRTRAVRAADGTYRITGTKIFITYGEQDLTENIVHLVLARTPDAPPGTRGISCFLVPKFLLGPDGSPAERNDVHCVSIEHKLGIHASPTCVLAFGDGVHPVGGEAGAVGYLLGEEQRGMATMFTMMNQARLSVGLEGLALAERAFQQALAYASERVQGRVLGEPAGTPIIGHPDVRRMLLTMRSLIDALRRLTYRNAAEIDRSKHAATPAERERAAELAALLTPLSKAWGTDVGVEVTGLGIQVHGGMGFIEETGAAQHWRDARITTIYEGTNGIQAIDLVGRKLPMRNGAVVAELLDSFAALDTGLADHDDLAETRARLSAGIALARRCSEHLLAHASDPAVALGAATPYLRMLAMVVVAGLTAEGALAARRGDGPGDEQFREAKVLSARFFCEQILPQADGLEAAIGASPAMLAFDPALLGR